METIRGSLAIITNGAVLLYLLKGVAFTVIISLMAVVIGLVFGSVLALLRNYCNSKKTRIFKWLAVAYREIFRNTPLLLWIFVCLVFCPCPDFLGRKMWGLSSAEVKLLFKTAVALILFTSSVIAEIVRGGLNSVAEGQFEAGHSQGFGTLHDCADGASGEDIKLAAEIQWNGDGQCVGCVCAFRVCVSDLLCN